MIENGNIDPKIQALVDASVFDDYGTMVLMRAIGSFIMAALLLVLVFYPLYVLLWRFIRNRFPAASQNLYLKKHKTDVRDANEYAAYLQWAESNGYTPLVERKKLKKKK